ncbi:MAG: helix-turn-helix domain-containing protein, partial [Bacteroidota bacterium]
HELRTPLTLIKANAAKFPTSGKDNASRINRLVAGMVLQIDRLLELDRSQSITPDLITREGNLVDFLQQEINTYRVQAEISRHQLKINVPEQPVIVRYTVDFWRSTIRNLLDNALKYSPSDTVITISLNVRGTVLYFQVADQGPGIPDAQKTEIFQRNRRLDQDQKNTGFGIGLHYLATEVSARNGILSVADNPGGGSVFTLALPVHLLREKVTVSTPVGTNDDTPPLILVIEDNREMATYIGNCLRDSFKVLIAHEGLEGFQLAVDEVPDAVVTDLMLPGMNGVELTRRLRAERATSHIPVILLTALSQRASRLSGIRAGADAYLTKPFDPEELLVRLNAQLTIREKIRQSFLAQGARTQVQGEGSGEQEVASAAPSENTLLELPAGQLSAPTTLSTQDANFIADLVRLIEHSISRVELNADELARDLAMSRTQLYRKLKALTGYSVNLYIRRIRLDRTAEKLRTTDQPIKEIAYDHGFSSPRYLSRLFKERFGQSPGDYRRR